MKKSVSILDPACVLPVAFMRDIFERAVRETPLLKSNTPLGIAEINGAFHHYMDPDTDTMWIGFALGMRCAERLAKANPNNLWLSPGMPDRTKTLASSPDAAKPVVPGEKIS